MWLENLFSLLMIVTFLFSDQPVFVVYLIIVFFILRSKAGSTAECKPAHELLK